MLEEDDDFPVVRFRDLPPRFQRAKGFVKDQLPSFDGATGNANRSARPPRANRHTAVGIELLGTVNSVASTGPGHSICQAFDLWRIFDRDLIRSPSKYQRENPMSKYVLAYRGGGMPESPEEGEKVMTAWTNWFGSLGAAVVDGGNPFGASCSLASDASVTDGAAAGLTGYSILTADDLAAASALAKGCPILSSGGFVDVYEALEMG